MTTSAFYNSLIKRPCDRSEEDVTTVFNHLRRLDVFERLHDAPLRSVCRTARLETHSANDVLFRKGQLATCWYILLSGSVFMNNQVYLPIGCFGKRSNMNLRRVSDCIVISHSDMIVIDYPDVQKITVHHLHGNNSNSSSNHFQSGSQPSVSATSFPAHSEAVDGRPSHSSTSFSSPPSAGPSPLLLVRKQRGAGGTTGTGGGRSNIHPMMMMLSPQQYQQQFSSSAQFNTLPPQQFHPHSQHSAHLGQQHNQTQKHHQLQNQRQHRLPAPPPPISSTSVPVGGSSTHVQHHHSHHHQQQQNAPPLLLPPHPHHHSQHQQTSQQQQTQQQIPAKASVTLCHRVPSPAPTFSSPTKVFHFPQNQPTCNNKNNNNNNKPQKGVQKVGGGVAFHPQLLLQQQQQFQHTKSNSMSSSGPTPSAAPSSSSIHQKNSQMDLLLYGDSGGGESCGMHFNSSSHEIEVPFKRAIKQPQHSKTLPRARTDTLEKEGGERNVQHSSPPKPIRTAVPVLCNAADASENSESSMVQKKKAMFESPSSLSSTPDGEDRSPPAVIKKTQLEIQETTEDLDEEEGKNDRTLTKTRTAEEAASASEVSLINNSIDNLNASIEDEKKIPKETTSLDTEIPILVETISSPKSPPPAASSFQRLSKIRLNMNNGRRNLQHQTNTHPNEEEACSPPSAIPLATNVRARKKSPQQQNRLPIPNCQPAAMINKKRQSVASGISALTIDSAVDCFADLPETPVDSEGIEVDDGEEEDDEEDEEEGSCPSHDSFHELRDSVRDCLEKEPANRSAEDLAVLIEFMTSLPSLAALPMGIKRQLCLKMVFAVVPTKGTPIMQHGERIDAWSVVVNGSVEHVHSNGQREEYRLGDCFGVQPVAQAQFNDGEIRTLTDDCEFVLVEHEDFYSIMSSMSRQIERENDDSSGEVVREVERRMVDNKVELVVTKASPERLLRQLLMDEGEEQLLLASSSSSATTSPSATSPGTEAGESGCSGDHHQQQSVENGGVAQMDSHFVEDLLLMHRVFFPDSTIVARQLIDWFRTEPKHRDKVARIMLIWLNNHFEDFETNDSTGKMTALLSEFDELLAEAKMFNHQCLLSITCSVKSQPRQVTLTRSDRAEPLNFQLVGGGGASNGGGIFILSVEANSPAERMGLRRGDEMLTVNGQQLRDLSLTKAEELIRESTHLSVTLKTNLIGFEEALVHQQQQPLSQKDQTTGGFLPSTNTISHRPNNNQQQTTTTAALMPPSRYQKKCSVPVILNAHHPPHPPSHSKNQQRDQQRERRSTLSAAINQVDLQTTTHYQKQCKAGSATPTGGSSSNFNTSGAVSHKKVLNKLLHIIRGGAPSADENNISSFGQQQKKQQKCSSQQQQSAGGFGSENTAAEEVQTRSGGACSSSNGGALRASRSNPDISVNSLNATVSSIGPCTSSQLSCASSSGNRHSSLCSTAGGGLFRSDQVLKVYRSDQSFRYIPVCAEMSVKQIVQVALQEFGVPIEAIGNDCCWWTLYECSVSREGVIKQKRLPFTAVNLVETVALNARLYLRNLQKEENTLLPDELIPEVLKQARLTLYTLNAQGIATQLTLQDFGVFSSIEPTEYINHLFQLGIGEDDNPSCSSKKQKGWSHLAEFELIFNREMWWVATEVCCERNVYRRSKLVKKFIKIARHCHVLRNLNSMFAIISGLEKPAVRRLAHTWERVPGKYLKMLADLQKLMDPSRNMSRYRQHLAQLVQEPPLIPIYPVLRKDLTFAHEANSTFCGHRLVNFEKLRMIAQIVRGIQRYSSVHYDPIQLLNGGGGAVDAGGAAGELLFQSDVLDPISATIRKAAMAGLMGGRFGTSGSSNSGAGGLSRKKLYERTLMLRRVRAYLRAMPLIDSEVELDRISLECEPPALSSGQSSSIQQLHHQQHQNLNYSSTSSQSQHSSHNRHHNNCNSSILHQPQPSSSSASTARRRLPSPSPSSLSSQSNQSSSIFHHYQQTERQRQTMMAGLPKFGVESPQAVQKMLALVQNSKIKSRQPPFFHHTSSGRPQFHHLSHGALSTSAELPPTGSSITTSNSSTPDENTSSTNNDNNNERAV